METEAAKPETSPTPEMLSKINKHFFPDNQEVSQSFLYLKDDITIDNCTAMIGAIVDANTLRYEKEKDANGEEVEVELPRDDVINMFITSSGGDMVASFALIDIMRGSKIPVRTIALGEASSAGLCILMAGHQRVITHHTSLMSHEFSSTNEGTYTGMKNLMREYDQYYKKMLELYTDCTKLRPAFIKKKLLSPSVDVYITPEEALKFNLIDLVSDLG